MINTQHNIGQDYPKTVNNAVQQLIAILSPQAKETIRNTSKDNLNDLQWVLGSWIGQRFGLRYQNQKLLNSCKVALGIHQALTLSPDHASGIIIESLWESLQQ